MTMTVRSLRASVLSFVRVLGVILLCRQQLHVSSECLMNVPSSLTLKNSSALLTANTSVTLRDLLQQLVHSVTSSDGGKLVDQVHLDLSRNGIRDFDLSLAANDSFTNIVVLDMSDNELEHLTEKVLSNFPNVWYVNLAFNAISVISDKSLPDSVRQLNISGNRLRRLERGMFNNSLQNLTASRNRISELLPGSLPTALTCLDLSFNEIRILLSGVFANLTVLRSLNLSHNHLAAIQPHAFYSGMTSLETADLSCNSLTSYEPWPYLFNRVMVDLRYNNISRFTNDMNMTVIRENKFTRVDLRHNALRSVTLQDLSIYFGGQLPNGFQVENLELNLTENPWVCDCAMYGLVALYNTSFLRILRLVNDLFTCQNPLALRGKTFGFLMDNPDSLTCRLTHDCPPGCSCQDRPHRGYVEVFCDRNQQVYTHLPAALPSNRRLFLNLSGHQLQALDPAVPYASRLYGLDVSRNRLLEVTSAFLDEARILVVLDVEDNQLTSLPPQVRKLLLQHLHVAGNPLQCSCSFVWFGEWLGSWVANVSTTTTNSRKPSSSLSDVAGVVADESKLPRDMESLTCQQPGGGLMIVVDMSDKSLGCRHLAQAVVAGVCCMVLLILCTVVAGWRKRYELKVWLHFRMWARCCGKDEGPMGDDNRHSRKFDVYISVDEEDVEAVAWVLQVLLPFLEGRTRPLRVYLPVRQEILGESKANARADTIVDSHNMLVLLTPGYVQNEWCRFEFDQACRHLEEESAGKLVLLKMAGEDYRNGEKQVGVTRKGHLPGGGGKQLPATEGCARRWSGAEDHQHAQQNGTNMRPASALPPDRDTVLTGGDNRRLFEAATADPSPGPSATNTTTTTVRISCNPKLAAAVPEHLPLDARHSCSRSRQVVARASQRQRALHGCSLLALVRCWCRCQTCRRPDHARRTHTNHLELSQFYDFTGQLETLESLSAFLAEGRYISLGEHLWREKVFYELSTYKNN